jgi:hypothetical protein
LIKNNVRAAAIELCERASVYQAELDPLTTVGNIYEYDLEAPSGTAVQKILWITHEGKDLEPLTSTLLEQRIPKWREGNGVPEYYVQQGVSIGLASPDPNSQRALSSTIVRAVLKPTHTSSACDDGVMNDYRDTIINGALFRLLRIPNKEWTDLQGARVYGSLFNEGTMIAERKARGADTGVARRVRYGGTTGAWRTRRRHYGRGG